MATIKDVARLAGVSVATVSRVINNSPKASEASRLAVHSAMESLSYHPNANARALAQQTTETVGLIVGDVSDPFFGAMGGGNGFMQMVQQFQQFKANFHGDPKAEVEKLLQSGKLSQAQLNQLQQMAKQFQSLMQ